MLQVLITGERRSGTTLLANFLNEQDGFAIHCGTFHFARLWRQLGRNSVHTRLTDVQIAEVCSQLRESDRLGKLIDPAELRFRTLHELYQAVLTRLTPKGSPLAAGHKTTRALAPARELLRAVPDLRVICLLRDPRDMVASALEKYGGLSIFHFLRGWQQMVARSEALLGDETVSDRFLLIRFEDLVLRTAPTLERLAAFLEVPRLTIPEAPGSGNSSFGPLRGYFDPSTVGRWRTANPAMGRITEIHLADEMESMKYVTTNPPGRAARNLVRWLARSEYLLRRAGVSSRLSGRLRLPRALADIYGLSRGQSIDYRPPPWRNSRDLDPDGVYRRY